MLKNRFFYFFPVIVLILAVTGWFMSRPAKQDTTGELKVVKKRAEPEFQHEGMLFFINGLSGDTLSRLKIEIVDNWQDINLGLMFRSKLEQDQGMFFIFENEEEQVFWMKDTGISLDVIFADADLRIVHMARHTVPYSKEPIMSIVPAKYVIEVNAGYCDNHQIENGDHASYYVFE